MIYFPYINYIQIKMNFNSWSCDIHFRDFHRQLPYILCILCIFIVFNYRKSFNLRQVERLHIERFFQLRHVFVELLLVKNTMITKCCCGKSRRGEKSIGLSSCSESEAGHSKCSCLKLGQACNRMCRCRNCCNPLNEKERKFRPARKNRKACMCGNGRKVKTSYFFLTLIFFTARLYKDV